MNGFEKLHNTQDEFIKKTLQEDNSFSQTIFDNISAHMNKTKVKVKKYSYKQQNIIIILLLLLIASVGLNIYLAVVKGTPITITNIFQAVQDYTSNHDKSDVENKVSEDSENNENIVENITENLVDNTINNIVDNTIFDNTTINPTISVTNTAIKDSTSTTKNEVPYDIVIIPETKDPEPIIPPEIDLDQIKTFVNQFAIGINKLDLQDSKNLESNTILLYITQQYFSKQSNSSASLSVNTDYAASSTNFHKFLNEFTANDYSKTDYIKSYNNYIGYISRSKAYVYGNDYTILSKEKYNCESVTITNKEDDVYTATAIVSRTYGEEKNDYEIKFSFKINNNYKYQKYKLLSLKSNLISGDVETVIHLVGN